MASLEYSRFNFTLAAKETLVLPSYKGSTLRGGFGHAFRKVVCALRKTDCSDCILKEKCVYSYVFETPPPSGTKIMRKYQAAPHPFVIEPPPEKRRGYIPGSEITFGLTLIGRAVDYLPYFIYTFDELGKVGLGKDKGKYELKKVTTTVDSQKTEVKSERTENKSVIPRLDRGMTEDVACEIIYDSTTKTLKSFSPSSLNLEFGISNAGEATPRPIVSLRGKAEAISLSFLTPTRINYDGHFVFDLEFHMLVRQLLRRLSLLAYFHCGEDPSGWDFRGIIKKAEEVKVKKRNFRWYDWERYSARQDQRMKMGGFVGEIIFEGDIGPFMPLIEAGEVLHVGKGTSFGLGRFKIQHSK